jgi:hypothetical protein
VADEDYSSFLAPDPKLAQLWKSFFTDKTINESQYNELSRKRVDEISKAAGGVSLGIGSEGYVTPNYAYSEDSGPQYASLLAAQEKMRAALAGQGQLTSSGTPGIYQKQYYDESGNITNSDVRLGKSNDPALKGTDRYDPNATGTQAIFYDAQGKKINPSQLSSTKTGQDWAAAGYDIGFGPGMIGPGIKADTTERDARIASRERSQRVEAPAQAEISPTPVTPSSFSTITPVATALPPIPVKTAPIDTILFDNDSVPIEIMTDLIFENIGGQELINIARNDTVNGQNVIYQPIKNLTAIQQQYNPNNIVSLQATSDKYFQNFSIKFDEKVPVEATGPAGAHVYVDPETGELVVEAVNMLEDEQIELEVTASGTIYEADI